MKEKRKENMRKNRMLLPALCVICGLFLFAGNVRAATIRLDVKSGDDITSELQMACRSGNIVVLPAGDFKVNYRVRLAGNLTVWGVADETTLTLTESDNVLFFIPAGGAQKVTLKNLILSGEKTTAAVARFYDTKSLTLSHVTVKGGQDVGVRFVNCQAVMNDCTVTKNEQEGVAVAKGKVTIKNCKLEENGREVKGNDRMNSEGNGIGIREKAVVTIKNTSISRNLGYGIVVATKGKLKMPGTKKQPNIITENAWSGVSMTGKGTTAVISWLNSDNNGLDPKKNGEKGGAIMGNGFGATVGASAVISHSTFNNNSNCGISIYDSKSRLDIKYSEFCNNKSHGIGGKSTVTINATGCTGNNNANHGIMMLVKSGGTIKNCTLSGNGENGLNAGAGTTKAIIVSGGHFDGNARDGIHIYEASGTATVKNAVMNENAGYGLRLRAAPKAVVKGCSFSGNGKGEIRKVQ